MLFASLIFIILYFTFQKIFFVGFYDYQILTIVQMQLFDFFYTLAESELGIFTDNYFPFLFFVAETLLILNLGGMVPVTFPVTGCFSVAFNLALVCWSLPVILGFQTYGLYYIAFFYMLKKLLLGSFLSIVEIISICSRLLTLSIRLFANITAGHILMETLLTNLFFIASDAVFYNFNFYIVVWVLIIFVVGVSLVLMFYESCVAFVQSYVFVLLTIYYLKEPLTWSDHYDYEHMTNSIEDRKKRTVLHRNSSGKSIVYWLPDDNFKYLTYLRYPDEVREIYAERFNLDLENYAVDPDLAEHIKYRMKFF
jgi:ATP synthase subunit 6